MSDRQVRGQWQGRPEVEALIERARTLTVEEVTRLAAAWDVVEASADLASAWYAAWYAVEAAALDAYRAADRPASRAAARGVVRAAALAVAVRDLIGQDCYDVHPDDADQ